MELTGILVGVLVAGWLLFLVPWFASRDGGLETPTPESEDADSVVIVRYGDQLAEVSTPHMRAKVLAEIRELDRRAARRRLVVLVSLVLLFAGVITASALSLIPWWLTAIPTALLVLFLGVARVTVTAMRQEFRERIAGLTEAGDEEDTICLDLTGSSADSVALDAPVSAAPSLWEPIEITKPTYVSSPVGPRTVRTISLGAPVVEVPEIVEEGLRATG